MAGFNDFSTTPASNASVGAINFSEGQLPSSVNNSARQFMADMRYELGAISSAVSAGSTTDLGATQEGFVVLSGSATITRFGTTGTAGLRKKIRFTGTPTIQHSTGGIICPGSANITVAAGDVCETVCESSNVWRITDYQRADGTALSGFSINALSAETAPASGDTVPTYNASAGANRKIAVSDLFKATNVLTAEAVPATADEIPTYNASAGAARKITDANLLKATNVLTAEAVPATGDEILTYNLSASAARKITTANLLKVIDSVTAETAAADTDKLVLYSASAGAVRSITKANLISGGAGLTLLSTATASASSAIDFTSLLSSTYDEYWLIGQDVSVSNNNAHVRLQYSTNNGSSWLTSGYQGSYVGFADTSTFVGEEATTGITLLYNLEAGNADASSFVARISNVNSASYKSTNVQAAAYDRTYGNSPAVGAGQYTGATTAINALRILPSTGTIDAGTFRLYGVRK